MRRQQLLFLYFVIISPLFSPWVFACCAIVSEHYVCHFSPHNFSFFFYLSCFHSTVHSVDNNAHTFSYFLLALLYFNDWASDRRKTHKGIYYPQRTTAVCMGRRSSKLSAKQIKRPQNCISINICYFNSFLHFLLNWRIFFCCIKCLF